MWVFGYGSLTWKVDFPYERKIVGYITGFDRRFFQHSTDHRGTPEQPGRVVTLVPSSPEARVWGIAYQITKENIESVVDHLDFRERGGYKRMTVIFHSKSGEDDPFEITIYVGTSDNKQFAGEADVDSIAQQIISSVGPSGTNLEYLFNLANTMREIAPDINDDHIFTIERRVLSLLDLKRINGS